MPTTPTPTAATLLMQNGTEDIIWFGQGGPDQVNILSWIDYLGFGRGNLAGSNVGANFSPPLSTFNGTITGTIDGVNLFFATTAVAANPQNINLYVNGIYQVQGLDYTLAGTNSQTIVFVVPPPLNAVISAT